ncbi:MAG: hypothetical protein RIC55_29465 [Pirellulaceae bacterium]
MEYLDLLMRVLHIFGASVLVGATLFMLMAVAPALGKLADERRLETFAALRPHWAMLVGLGTGLLLVSGLYNTAMISIRYKFPEVNYHALLGIKIGLALVVFALAAIVSGRSGLAERLRQKMTTWLAVTLTLLVVTMSVGAYMKSAVRVEKPPAASDSGQTGSSHPARG